MHLSVVTPTYRRHKLLHHCLQQFTKQSLGGLYVEHIVVSDGPDKKARDVAKRFPGVRYYETSEKDRASGPGSVARDFGIREAKGEYVCFWDDDNQFYPHALASLYSAAYGFGVGIVKIYHTELEQEIPDPWNDKFEYGNIDTACLCVQTELAQRHLWAGSPEYASDIVWLNKVQQSNPSKRYVPVSIGVHL